MQRNQKTILQRFYEPIIQIKIHHVNVKINIEK